MYLDFYNLREFPFTITCDDRFFYESAVHAETLANMMYTVQQRKGMVLVTGEVGAGKTFVGNMLGSRLGVGCQTVLISNPPQSSKQLLSTLARRLGMNVRASADKASLVEELERYLVGLNSRGRLVALILDEAQDLSPASLEELRLLWNWEQGGRRLIQIVLIGQPELRQRLLEPKWEALRQRVVLSYHLQHLSPADTPSYIAHRLRVAGGDACSAQFTASALTDIHAATDGIPRLINILCDNALLVGYAKEVHCIDSPIVAEVVRDMTCWGLRTPSPVPQAAPASGQE
ncbi:MAG TPA: AAA family ATPase [Phycisphaerae bacterium]|nr:AAA family ATPase [Phycisphaerae bacterium]